MTIAPEKNTTNSTAIVLSKKYNFAGSKKALETQHSTAIVLSKIQFPWIVKST